MNEEQIRNELLEASVILKQFIEDPENIRYIQLAASVMSEALKRGNKIISCGNGGSMCDAMHFAEELSGRYRNDRPALAAVAISDPAHITCTGNDYGFDNIFSRYLEAMGKQGDVLLAVSTSGNSENIIRAARTAGEKGMKIIALTGKNGGVLAGLSDVEIRAPYSDYSDRVQEIHIKVIHILISAIEKNIFETVR
ncbi:MAG: D-sedoheptulose 7-phosphate isomerase [Bacteroidia bacterium]|nr:D-sedoheptulose 7-phosphate isomerase [Bacteroidia bacterium]